MSISFSTSELINIAIDIERRGMAFYDVMSQSTENAEARDLFRHLGEMERQHVQIFRDMLGEAGKYQPSESDTEEYAAYLKALVDSAVFTDDLITSGMAANADSDIEALQLAIGAEKDAILFYYLMMDIMPPRTHPVVNKIIAEEKLHLRQLSEAKKRLAAL
ncbi:ferritin family protein [Dehalococcoidia bacterium]|nr:ferritin family protein [Dehalococcoidia bacterium]MCL0079905.1 ferritin family protein [Dehalococcoidia bacterium]MCL0093916.1 ferritin family protein [Dehalococcoidia bacterium]